MVEPCPCQRTGWICEEHDTSPWPHDDCPGPGMPCECPYSVTSGVRTFLIDCAWCDGAVTIKLAQWQPSHGLETADVQAWVCPHCWQKNTGTFPGRLAWVTKRLAV